MRARLAEKPLLQNNINRSQENAPDMTTGAFFVALFCALFMRGRALRWFGQNAPQRKTRKLKYCNACLIFGGCCSAASGVYIGHAC